MQHQRGVLVSPWALATLVALVLGSASFNWVYHLRVVDRLDRIETQTAKEQHMLTTKWKSDGKQRTWTSTRGEHEPNETIGELAARHKAELEELYEEFPEDAVGTIAPVPAGDER